MQIQQMLSTKFSELTKEEPRASEALHERWQERMTALHRLPAMRKTYTWSRRTVHRNTDGGVIWTGSFYGVGQMLAAGAVLKEAQLLHTTQSLAAKHRASA